MNTARFTPDEEDTLCLSPFWVYSSLTGRHRGLDDAELDVLFQCVARAGDSSGNLVAEILTSVQKQTERLRWLYEHDERSVSAGLSDVATALSRASRSEAQLFRRMLVSRLGVLLATAIGPFGRSAQLEDLLRLQLLPALLAEPESRPFQGPRRLGRPRRRRPGRFRLGLS